MDLLHHLLVPLHLETKVSIMVKICRNSELDLHSLKVVWHKEVTRILHVLSVVGSSQHKFKRGFKEGERQNCPSKLPWTLPLFYLLSLCGQRAFL
ncbi:hypothetical protein H5410_006501 [Solanum commersonii]|uniref:Uncharacterized protein n=1 Tax=Solanum commersonii TaxID=4109 RepID=A0A9J6AAG4_SOLCO|nr:hypothetical protein H5410_006501 [Solanum commersonii]